MLEKLKRIQLKKIIYPGILSFVFILTALGIALSANFVSGNVNKALISNSAAAEAQIIKLNLEGYNRIVKKLGIKVQKKEESAPQAETLEKTESVE